MKLKLKWSGKRTLIAVALLAGVLALYAMGAQKRQEESRNGTDPTAGTGTAQCRVASTVDGLNVRSAPALDPKNVVDQLGLGEEADAAKVVQNGFRKLVDGRWVSVRYVHTVQGRQC
ncbi:SH3 domain-containing protein [Actinophytocola sp.]|uniref:SH3 domain-containing protein n=1 Tax=Actinophytocola sp. TaxID=1872138 RepID=UPI002EDB011F